MSGDLLQALESQHRELLQLVALLEREQAQLCLADPDQLVPLAEEKRDRLSRLFARRLPRVAADPARGDARDLLCARIVETAQQAKLLNLVNGRLLNARLRMASARLAALGATPAGAPVYSADGTLAAALAPAGTPA